MRQRATRVRRAMLVLSLAGLAGAQAPLAPTVTQMPPTSVVGVLGHPVLDPNHKEIGRIVDVLVDDRGMPRAAVLNVGGFLGMGDRSVAVAWPALHVTPTGSGPEVTLDIPADRIKAAPLYVAGQKVQILTQSASPE